MIWNMGDALLFSPEYVYGLQGHSLPGNSNVLAHPREVSTSSIFVDLDGQTTSCCLDKTQYGDVEIFRDPCCNEIDPVEPDACSAWETLVRNQGFDIQQLGATNTITITPPPAMGGSDWWTLDVNCNQPPQNVVRFNGAAPTNLGTNGSYLLCIDAYRVVDGDTCRVSFTYDGSINFGPAACCLPAGEFRANAARTLDIDFRGSEVTIAAPDLSECSELLVDFGDGSELREYVYADLPIRYRYTRTGSFSPRVDIFERDANGERCNGTTVSTSEASGAGNFPLKVFPNPHRGRFVTAFDLRVAGEVTAEVYDLSGKRVRAFRAAFPVGEQQWVLDTEGLPSGTYVLRLVGASATATARFQQLR